MDNKQFYYGTSTNNQLSEWLAPSTKACRRGYKKVSITNNLLAAKYYAEKAAVALGGTPVVYEVEPEYEPLRRNKTDWTTTKAKIIKALTIEEVDAIIEENS